MSDGNHTTPLKRCPKCGNTYPKTTEHWPRNRSTSDGLSDSYCKPCHRETTRAWRAANPEREREARKALFEKYPNRNREYRRRYYKANAERLREEARLFRKLNPESAKNSQEKYRASNPESTRQSCRKWRASNKAKVRELSRNRRAREFALPIAFTPQDESLTLDYFNGCCAVCERPLKDLFSTHTAAMDHWIPLSKGGHTTPDNMIPLCHGVDGCNNSKRNSDPVEWLNRKFGKRKATAILTRIEAYFEYIKSLAVQDE